MNVIFYVFSAFCSSGVEFGLFMLCVRLCVLLHVLREIDLVHVAFLEECVVEGVSSSEVVP